MIIEEIMTNQIRLVPNEVKSSFSSVRFLSEDEQTLYEKEIKRFEGQAYNSLDVPLYGSNLFKVLFLNQMGIKTARLNELELTIENGMELRDYYEDRPVVVLRSNSDSYEPNNYLAKKLALDLNLSSFEAPYIIEGLKIEKDNKSR